MLAWIIGGAALLSTGWVTAQYFAEQYRARRLQARARMHDVLERHDTLATRVGLEALAKALRVPVQAIRLSDRFDEDYRIPFHRLFLDETDEVAFHEIDAKLRQLGYEPFRTDLRNVRTVADLLGKIEGHVLECELRSQMVARHSAGEATSQ